MFRDQSSGCRRELHVTQPALHTQVSRLGNDLGVRLYRRAGRRLELTAEGIEVQRFATDLMARGAAFVERLRGGDSRRAVSLAAGEGSFLYLLGDALKAFQRRSRHSLRLLTRDRQGTLDAMRSGDADLGVAALEELPHDLSCVLLRSARQVLVVPATHRLSTKRSVCLTDLAGEKLIVPPLGRPQRSTIAQALLAAHVSWSVAVEANGWELTVRFVELGLGLAIVNEFVRVPRGLAVRSLHELPAVQYYLLGLPDEDRIEVRELQAQLMTLARR